MAQYQNRLPGGDAAIGDQKNNHGRHDAVKRENCIKRRHFSNPQGQSSIGRSKRGDTDLSIDMINHMRSTRRNMPQPADSRSGDLQASSRRLSWPWLALYNLAMSFPRAVGFANKSE